MTDADGFEQFAESQAGALARLAYRLTGHRESARDLVQEVLLDSFRQWPKVSAASDRGAYVRRMLVNRHLNGVRRRRITEIAQAEPYDTEPLTRPASHGDVVDDRDAMWRALAGLPDRQRTVLVLRYYEGLEDPAIAELVGCRRTTVRSLVARGLAALRTDPHLQQPVTHPTRRSNP